MGTFTVGSVVLVQFPFFDLSGSKFTANVLIFMRSVGTLKSSIQSVLVDKVVSLIRNQG